MKHDEKLTATDSVFAHAAMLKALSESDAVVGRALHDMQRHKHFALAIVESQRGTAMLRVSFVAQDGLTYAQLLIGQLANRGTIQIGRKTCDISNVTVENGPWSGISTWADITAASKGRRLLFSFAAPTAITKRGQGGDRFFSLFPDPVDIFSGLARRWQALDGAPLPGDLADFLRAGGCAVSNYDLHTVEFHTPDRTQIGFVGSTTFEYRGTSQLHLATLQALTRLAFFTGVGYQTARGMGLVQTRVAE